MAATLERAPKIKKSPNGKIARLPQEKPRVKKSAPIIESIIEPVTEKLLTAEEYWETCNSDHSELIDGKVVEHMPPGGQHGEIAGIIFSLLLPFVRKHKLGRVFVESGYRLNSGNVRSPDVSFIEYSRLPDGRAPRAFIEGAPTLAVEVISPGDEWSDVEAKVRLYLHAGTSLVWLIDPTRENVTARSATESHIYDKTEILSGEPILPGFKLPLKDIFDL